MTDTAREAIDLLEEWIGSTDWDAAGPEEGQRANAVHTLIEHVRATAKAGGAPSPTMDELTALVDALWETSSLDGFSPAARDDLLAAIATLHARASLVAELELERDDWKRIADERYVAFESPPEEILNDVRIAAGLCRARAPMKRGPERDAWRARAARLDVVVKQILEAVARAVLLTRLASLTGGARSVTDEDVLRAERCYRARGEFFGCDDNDSTSTDSMQRVLEDFVSRHETTGRGDKE